VRTNARIYVMRGQHGLKIGHSGDPQRRLEQIGADAIEHETDVLEHAQLIEHTAHRLLRLAGKHVRGEWFSATLHEAVDAIERAERIAAGQELPLVRPIRAKTQTSKVITVSLPIWMLDEIDNINRDERYGQADRASLIREAVAFWLADRR
jgi:hypothetical protein